LDAADLGDIFLCAGPFTALVPSNAAFDALDPSELADLQKPENQESLRELLFYHILPGYMPTNTLQVGPAPTLLFGYNVTVALNPIKFDDANILFPNVNACNGVAHIIDNVMIPGTMPPPRCDPYVFNDGTGTGSLNILETARQNPDLTIIVTLIQLANLADIFDCPGQFTALFPTNAAFDELDPKYLESLLDLANIEELKNILLFHIIPGSQRTQGFSAGPIDTLLPGEQVDVRLGPLQFDEANVLTPDISASNGLIDIINKVLLPFPVPSSPTTAPTSAPSSNVCANYTFNRRIRKLQDGGRNCSVNIIDTALANPDLSIVTTLLQLAGLDVIFQCAGPFTALLPTDTSFDTVNTTFLDSLVDPANIDLLTNFLLYHILPGATMSTMFVAGPLDTLFIGNQVNVTLNPLQFDNRTVGIPDIAACNGYILILNGVLNPFEGRKYIYPEVPRTSVLQVIPRSHCIHRFSRLLAPTNTSNPTVSPTAAPAAIPTTSMPSASPVKGPTTLTPATTIPTSTPTISPSTGATGSPTVTPTAAPTGLQIPTLPPRQTVRVQKFYISYVAPQATREPTPDEYQQMLTRTVKWFEQTFTSKYTNNPSVQFLGAEGAIAKTLYGANASIPEPRFNILIGKLFRRRKYGITLLDIRRRSSHPHSLSFSDLFRFQLYQSILLGSLDTTECKRNV
jgi:uncharacterized surface protein with fasciclin (FAS1) repeats